MYQDTVGTAMQNGQCSTRGTFQVELGLAQGDPLSPTRYLVFINSLLEETTSKCKGVSLGSAQQLVAQMFADDFTGLAEDAEGIAAMIPVVINFCETWRIKMNPAKCSVLVVGPDYEVCKRLNRTWQWGTTSIPLVESTKYLGVMINHNMNWDVHAEYVLMKAEKAASAIWSALSDNRINMYFRRLLLTSLVKPVMEHACEVWEPSKLAARKLQSFYSRLQRKMLHCHKNVHHAIVGADLGCPSLESSRAQLRAEAAKRIHIMQADRLPKVVTGTVWGAKVGRGRPRKLWVDRSKENLKAFKIDDVVIADKSLKKMDFKKLAIRCAADKDKLYMEAEAVARSTVKAYLELDNVSTGRSMRHYLDSSNRRGAELMFQCRASSLLLNSRTAKWSRHTARTLPDGTVQSAAIKECQCCSLNVDETMVHFLMDCPCFEFDGDLGSLGRTSFLVQLKQLVGAVEFGKWELFSKEKRVQLLLGESFWGKKVGEVHDLFQKFLVSIWKERESVVADFSNSSCSARGDTGRVANGQLATAHI
jgi:hypothetical protein